MATWRRAIPLPQCCLNVGAVQLAHEKRNSDGVADSGFGEGDSVVADELRQQAESNVRGALGPPDTG